MADFKTAFQLVISNEGGYSNDADDSGGETYKGISRKNFPDWLGWVKIDEFKKWSWPMNRLEELDDFQQAVEYFYKVNFWDKINGDLIASQKMANSIFDFAVNAGVVTSSQIAQRVVGFAEPDGSICKNTLAKLNIFDPELFVSEFTVEKVRHYIKICKKRPESRKFFFGWIDRAVNG